MKKKILIVAASIGSGHMQAAKAVRDEFLRKSPDASIHIVDFMDQDSSLGHIIKETYLNMIDYIPNAYDLLYRYSQEPRYGSNVKSLLALIMKKRMRKLCQKYQPDLVVFTHPFPCCAAAYLKAKGQIAIPLAAVITDFSFHQMWLHPAVDSYFVANEETREELLRNGIAASRVYVTGIPIAAKFSESAVSTRERSPKLPTILVMGGGFGLGALEETVSNLLQAERQMKIIVLTGKNDSLLKKIMLLRDDTYHQLSAIGYTERVHEIMAAATLLITKPGGLTCSEALAMQLPMLLLKPLPGQEEENADYLTQQGVALRLSDLSALASITDSLLAEQEILQLMRRRAQAIGKATAADTVTAILTDELNETADIYSAM